MLDFLLSPIVIGVVLGLIVLIALVVSINRLYVNVPTDQAAIITGGRKGSHIVHGGGFFRIPLIQQYRMLSLQTMQVNLMVENVYSSNNVPVTVRATAQVRIPGEESAIETAAQRFQSTTLEDRKRLITDTLEAVMRQIIATMTIEELNSQRDMFKSKIRDDSASEFASIGHAVEMVNINSISDDQGYLEALGARRIAEVKRDAEVAQADSNRDARERVAESNRLAAEAEASSVALTAAAERDRDTAIERARADVEAQRAKTEQAGPLARAQAARDVAVAEEQTNAARQQAALEVEQRRTARAEQAAKADTIVPAMAEKEAQIARAEGERQADILRAEAEAEAVRTRGDADASSRKELAAATEAELTAQANGRRAQLSAEASGQQELAEAFKLSPDAANLQMLPTILENVVNAVAKASEPLGNIDNVSIIGGGGGNDGNPFGSLQSSVPSLIANVMAVFKQQGIDISQLMPTEKNSTTTSTENKE